MSHRLRAIDKQAEKIGFLAMIVYIWSAVGLAVTALPLSPLASVAAAWIFAGVLLCAAGVALSCLTVSMAIMAMKD